jgi:hypothetical protein
MVTVRLPPEAAEDKARGVREAEQEGPEGIKTRMRWLAQSAIYTLPVVSRATLVG